MIGEPLGRKTGEVGETAKVPLPVERALALWWGALDATALRCTNRYSNYTHPKRMHHTEFIHWDPSLVRRGEKSNLRKSKLNIGNTCKFNLLRSIATTVSDSRSCSAMEGVHTFSFPLFPNADVSNPPINLRAAGGRAGQRAANPAHGGLLQANAKQRVHPSQRPEVRRLFPVTLTFTHVNNTLTF